MNINSFIPYMKILAQSIDIEYENQKKIQECIDRWYAARKLPRKLKKKEKQKAEKDYNFWMAINKWHLNMFKRD